SAISTSSRRTTTARVWWVFAVASLPVALWWLGGLTPGASVLAFLIVAIPALIAIRAAVAVFQWPDILAGLVTGAIFIVAALGAMGRGVVIVPLGLVALGLEL